MEPWRRCILIDFISFQLYFIQEMKGKIDFQVHEGLDTEPS